jgi:hypothetical protein
MVLPFDINLLRSCGCVKSLIIASLERSVPRSAIVVQLHCAVSVPVQMDLRKVIRDGLSFHGRFETAGVERALV